MANDGFASSVIPEVSFRFETVGVDVPWVVSEAVVRERLSAPYEGTVVVSAPDSLDPTALLAKPCTLTLLRDDHTRCFVGVVTAVEDRGVDRESRVFEVAFGPSLALLEHGAHYRVWQGLSALAVVREVLLSAGVYRGDALSLPDDTTPPREYCVQYGERDLAFVQRLLAEEGLLFTFGESDALVVFDATAAVGQPEVRVLGLAGEALPLQGGGQATASAEGLRRLDLVRAVTPQSVALRDYDFTHPAAPLASGSPQPRGALEQYPARAPFGPYDGARSYGPTDVARGARISLQRASAGAALLRGEGSVTGMRPGTTFAVEEAGERGLRGKSLLTSVLHMGTAPEATLSDARGPDARDRYRNVFECVPVERAWAPSAPPRPRAEQAQVAVVVPEPGSDDEICTDHYGRVLVRFPWDRPEARTASQSGARDSCWLRVMQPWAGPGWGFHFTPRVGMEVVVHFLDGDPDRPYVAGCLPNAVNVPPVELPQRKTQSAIRTLSSPGGGGFNELRFEDQKGEEEVYVHAQRDQRIEVLHDRSLTVGRDARAEIGRDESHSVGRDRSLDVAGDEQHSVEGDRSLSVTGNEVRDVGGNHALLVHKSFTMHADEQGRISTNDGLVIEVGGGSGACTEMTPDAVRTQTPKRHAVAVGDDVAQEMTTERVEVRAPKGIALVCGDTRIELEEDRVVLQTKSGARVELNGDKITVKTSGSITLKGSQINEN